MYRARKQIFSCQSPNYQYVAIVPACIWRDGAGPVLPFPYFSDVDMELEVSVL